jgi:two-component system sensor histidine kinase MtrB
VLQSVLSKIAREALPQGTQVDLDVPDDLAVIADPLVLDRVVSNLLANAARHGSPPILLAAEQRDRHIRISVADGGEGVPDEIRPYVFERFERGADAPGSGLGLAIARAYAQAHGGDLLYDDTGEGARFEVVIPRSSTVQRT